MGGAWGGACTCASVWVWSGCQCTARLGAPVAPHVPPPCALHGWGRACHHIVEALAIELKAPAVRVTHVLEDAAALAVGAQGRAMRARGTGWDARAQGTGWDARARGTGWDATAGVDRGRRAGPRGRKPRPGCTFYTVQCTVYSVGFRLGSRDPTGSWTGSIPRARGQDRSQGTLTRVASGRSSWHRE